MYSKLKVAMAAAGHKMSDGPALLANEQKLATDFLYFRGMNLGGAFHLFDDQISQSDSATTVIPAQESASESLASGAETDPAGADIPATEPTSEEAAPEPSPTVTEPTGADTTAQEV